MESVEATEKAEEIKEKYQKNWKNALVLNVA